MLEPTTSALGPPADELASTAFALARRFNAGATLWCCAPAWPAHARHVAVEFVHPVIVGKRALPAVAVEATDLIDNVRANARDGDIVLAVAPADDPAVADLMRRANAWGVTTVWIGAGPRPAGNAANHVLWVDGASDHARAADLAPFDGRFVLLYHLLWELTHVCFEHPGLLQDPDACTDAVCVTCSDEGRVAEVLAPTDAGAAPVRTARGSELVDVSLVGPVRAGELLLVHAGVAISSLETQ
jgi:hypothetical protein